MNRISIARVAISIGVLAVAAVPVPLPAAAAAAERRPNVVVITTDDMRADDLALMPRTRRLVGRLDLTEFVSNHPLCCPARAQLLTGQLAQHNGVHANSGPTWGGYSALKRKNNTVARWFRRSGYSTALVGKFLNGWCPAVERPRGWTDFKPLVGEAYSAYGYSHFDGRRVRPAPPGMHTNDFVTTRTLGRIKAYATARRPFLIWSSYVAPHGMSVDGTFGPPVPAARHRGTMEGVIPVSESNPSYEDVGTPQVARALPA
jgi:arylsulfatase A-like enzyme